MKASYKIRSVKYNFMMNMILKISQYIFPLISLPYITRALGAIGLGKATSVITYFSMFAQLGIPSYGIRECAKIRDDKVALTKLVQELIIINTISVVISYSGLFILMIFVKKLQEEPVLLLIQSITILLNMIGIDWLYQAIEQYQYITIRNISFKFLSLVLMFMFIHNPNDYIKYAVLIVVSGSGSNLLNLFNSRKILEKKTFRGQYELKRHLKPIFIFFFMSIAVSIYTSLDTVMLGFISSDTEVAYYTIATKIKMVLASTVAAIGPVLLPRITYCLHNGQNDKFYSYISKSIHFVLLISLPFTIFFAALAPNAIMFLGGSEYIPATMCMRVISFTIIPLGIGNVAASQILAPSGREIYTMYSTIVGAVIDFGANLLLIPRYGATGAAVATVITEIIVAIVQVKFAWDKMKSVILHISYFKLLFSNVFSSICLFVILKFSAGMNYFLQLIFCAVAYFGVYAVILIVIKDTLVKEYFTDKFFRKNRN